MFRKAVGVLTTLFVALTVVGVAWAGTDDASNTPRTSIQSSTSASLDASSSVSVASDESSSSSTTLGDTSSSSSTTEGSSSSTTQLDDSTTTTREERTSTTSDEEPQPSDGISVHVIPNVGVVTIEISSGQLLLIDVTALGWRIERERVESDRIRIELVSGDAEAEFEARIEGSILDVEIDVDLD